MRDTQLYTTLGVASSATDTEIKKSYRKLAKELHPDRNPGDEAAEQRFKEVSAAYEVLSDPERRKLYDEFGSISLKPGFDPQAARAWGGMPGGGGGFHGGGFPGGVDLSDLLNGLFHQNRDVQARLELDLESALRGGEQSLRFADGRSVKVRIPKGIRDGETLRLRGQGRQDPRGGVGDLLLTIDVLPHPELRRDGMNLHRELEIDLVTALAGGGVQVPTLDGPVQLRIPPGTSSHSRLRLKGKGVKRKGAVGDLYVQVKVRVPKLDEAQRQAVVAALSAEPELSD